MLVAEVDAGRLDADLVGMLQAAEYDGELQALREGIKSGGR